MVSEYADTDESEENSQLDIEEVVATETAE